jgi:glycerophosphoryl diester phosphodiesterase
LRNKGIKIPTLDEVFNAFPRTRINLEIKDARSGTIQSLCRMIRSHHMTEKVMVASFDANSLKEFRSLCPQVATSAGASEVMLFYGLQKVYLEAAYSPDAQALQVPETFRDLRVVNRRFIEAAHARNMGVQVWTVNDIDSMKRLLKLGVDGIMTDYPQRLLELLKKQ